MGLLLGALVGLGFAALVLWAQSHEVDKIGPVKCNRCGHVDRPLYENRPNKGAVFLCRKCRSEDWVKIETVEKAGREK